MSDFTYNWVVRICRPAFTVSSCPLVLHRERAAMPGGYILAPNHLSAYDVPCLMAQAPRNLDFVSITELYENWFVATFFNGMNVFPLDRSKPDSPTVRIILERLRRGRAVVMFPEGKIPSEAESVLNGGPIKPGVARIAHLADAPVIPCVILGTGAYAKPSSWAPVRGVRYAIAYGRPLRARTDLEESQSRAQLLSDIKRSYRELHAELLQALAEERPGFWQRLSQRLTTAARRPVAAGRE
jgi:1-acyl-sn-glycerol-3-phosphate acyltransferase